MHTSIVIGIGIGENFIASDQLALRQVTDRFVYLEEGDIAEITPDNYTILDAAYAPVSRDITQIVAAAESVDKGHYRHFMLKEMLLVIVVPELGHSKRLISPPGSHDISH